MITIMITRHVRLVIVNNENNNENNNEIDNKNINKNNNKNNFKLLVK